MRECLRCFKNIFDEATEACPNCGGRISLKNTIGESSIKEAGGISGEEIREYHKSLALEGVCFPQDMIAREAGFLKASAGPKPRVSLLSASLNRRSIRKLDSGISDEDYKEKFDEFIRICSYCIFEHGGFIADLQDHSLVAVFGGPGFLDQDTISAVESGLEIRNYCRRSRLEESNDCCAGVAVTTGSIVIRKAKNSDKKPYEIRGRTASRAIDLSRNAREDELIIDSTTSEVIGRDFDMEEADSHYGTAAGNGKFYRVIRAREKPEIPESEQTPFTGRKKEKEQLEKFFLSETKENESLTAHLSGEPGIGKTRLTNEALKSVETKEGVVFLRGDETASGIMFYPIINYIREKVGLEPEAPGNLVKKMLEKYVRGHYSCDDSDSLLLEYFFGVPEAVEKLKDVPSDRMEKNIFSMLRRFITPRNHGVILILDDAHAFDEGANSFLRRLRKWPGKSGIKILQIYRKHRHPPLKRNKEDLKIILRDLSAREKRQILKHIIPVEDFLPEIRKTVLSRSGGNPLFMEEMVQIIREEASSNPNLDGELLVNRIIEVIPESLSDLIRSRMDRLEQKTKQTLQHLSLLGPEFCFSALEMFDEIHDGLTEHLHILCARKYLSEFRRKSGLRFRFNHNLIRETAYASLQPEQKKTLHREIGYRMEEYLSNRLPEYYELLAFHFGRGEQKNKALYYLIKSGDRESGLGDDSNAARNYAEVIEILRGLPPEPDAIAQMSRVLTDYAHLRRKNGENQEAMEMLESARQCAGKIENAYLLLQAELETAITSLWMGRLDAAEKQLLKLRKDASELNNISAEMIINNSLGVIYWRRGEFKKALHEFQALASISGEAGDFQIQADAFNNAGLIFWRWEQYSHALKAYRRALPLRRMVNDLFGECATLMNMGIIEEQRGEIGSAHKHYLNAVRLAEKTGYIQALSAAESNLSNLERRAGTLTAALEHADNAVRFSRLSNDPLLMSIGEENRGLALYKKGYLKSSKESLDHALKLAKKQKNPERQISVRLSLLERALEEKNPRKSIPDEINDILTEVEKRHYPDLLPRIYRLKSQILQKFGEDSGDMELDYLIKSREISRNSGYILEEIDSLNVMLSWARAKRDHDKFREWEQDMNRLRKVISLND